MKKLKKKTVLWATLFASLGIGIFAFAYDPFAFQLKVDHTTNAIDMNWKEPDSEEPYTYKVYQDKEGKGEFQSISTASLKEKVNVLNVYPTVSTKITYTTADGTTRTNIDKSASLEMWMEKPNDEDTNGYGMGLIDVDPVNIKDFNDNPSSYLNNADGSWKYDAVMFGSWDTNGGGQDISQEGSELIQKFIQAGRGVLLGHDTIYHGWTGPKDYDRLANFNRLMPLMNVSNIPGEYLGKPLDEIPDQYQAWGSDQVVLQQKGLFTKYPWDIGEVGTVLNIPYTHTGWIMSKGDNWMSFKDIEGMMAGTGEQDKYMANPNPQMNAYLSTWNNTAMIQTGHSAGAATPDEQKILANTLFYLSQLTTSTSHLDRSGMDVAAPGKTSSLTYDNSTNEVRFTTSKDNGSTYQYYVEAIGQDTGMKKKSQIKSVTNTSGLSGYSYVVDDKTNTMPDNKVEETSNRFDLDLSKATGNYLHIVAVDKAGNISEVTHKQLNLLEVEGSVDYGNNAIDLDWNNMPDKSQPYTYKVYQKKNGSNEFQSVSTADLNKEVRVLNVYPENVCANPAQTITYKDLNGENVSIPISASLKKWMEEPTSYVDENGNVVNVPYGYGKGLISVDIVGFDQYNVDPNKYLQDTSGNYQYDVLVFGIADCNGRTGLTTYSKDITADFIESGRGVFFGHDTVYTDSPRKITADLAEEYMNMTVTGTKSYRDTKVVIERDGLLTEYPWDIGGVGTELTIPQAHTSRQIPNDINDVWMKFKNGPSEIGNFYLTSYNNLAMSQTGHSTGQATSDEQKILANTMFYLSQLTTDTEIKDRSGMDVATPVLSNKPNVTLSKDLKLNVSYPAATDRGSNYEYFVEATGQNDGRIFKSNIIKLTNKSGLAGYSYHMDNNPKAIPDNKVDTTSTSFTVDVSSEEGNYLHIAAVDKVGNVSEVIHYKIDDKDPGFEIESSESEWTNQSVTLKIVNIDDYIGFGYEKTLLPNGLFTNSDIPTYTVGLNGTFSFSVYDKANNFTTKEIVVSNIDTGEPSVIIREKSRGEGSVNIRFDFKDE